MIRAVIVALSAFFIQIFLSALFVPFETSLCILIVPAALILVTNEFYAHEALVSLLLLGLLLDAWIGAPVGVIMSVLSLMYIMAATAIIWLGKPDIWIRTAFIFFFSLAFRVCVALALGIAGGSKGNWEWAQLFGMPFIDVALGLVFYHLMMWALPIVGLSEVKENTSERLSRRSPRIRLE